MINAEDMKSLEGYEYYFRSAIENGFCRNFGTKQYTALNDIYERITGSRYKADISCPHCALAFIKRIGGLYFEEKKRLEELKVQEQLEPKTVTTSEPKRKGGRQKKSATNNEQKPE